MWGGMLFESSSEIVLVLVGLGVVVCAIVFYRIWKISSVTPEERERRRRAALVAHGKMGDATLTDLLGDFLFYSYDVRGVEYTASQDLSMLKEYLPPDFDAFVGAVSVRYDPKIPANSIVVAEAWSGLRSYSKSNEAKARKPGAQDPQPVEEKARKAAPQHPL
jgi:hypothetical protein